VNGYGQPYTDAEKWQMQQRFNQVNTNHQIPTVSYIFMTPFHGLIK